MKFNYEAQGADNDNQPTLRSIDDAGNQRWTLNYAGKILDVTNLVANQRFPRGNTPYNQTYESKNFHGADFPRVTRQTDAYGNQTQLNYDSTNNILNVTWPDSSIEKYKHHSFQGFPEYFTDANNKTITFTRNADEEYIIGMTDRMGDGNNYAYHLETGMIASIINAAGRTTTFSYVAQDQNLNNPINGEPFQFRFFNLGQITYPNPTTDQFTYDAKGNALTHKNRVGDTWTYTYNTRGQVLTETNPTGGVTTRAYNADGTLALFTDSDIGVTTYQYDALKRVVQINYPDGTNLKTAYNANDKVTQITDRRGVVYTFEYDANNNVIRIVRASGTAIAQTHQYQYDNMDRLMKYINPSSKETQYAYTYWDGLQQITYHDATQVSIQYDPRRWINRITDEGAKIWQIGRDDESVYSSFTTPQNRVVNLTTDKLGYTTQVTDPLGKIIKIDRDALERVIKITDRLNREMTFGRDAEGRITSITMPVIGTVTYVRDGLGLVTRITDQRGNNWDFEYTGMGRIKKIKDPMGNEWTYTYNNMGRILQITYPDGVTETRTYDGNGNLTKKEFSGGLTLTYAYDQLNRRTNTGSVAVALTYDNRDNITNTQMGGKNFGATYDDRSRVKTVTYDGQMTVTYTYDSRGLVTEVKENLTNSWVRFTYDNDRLLIKIERSNGIATDIERNANGRITRIKHGNKGEMNFTLDAEDQISKIIESLPLDVASFLASELRQYTYDAADRITAAGFNYDSRGRRIKDPERDYNWDSADRLTGITQGSTNITYEYTGQGEVAKRTVNGVTTEYFYNYAVKDHPIMAERRNGGYIRFYVCTPDGRLLYYVDVPSVQAYFYHFNHIGTTLFLTNGTGNVTDSYGYTPYGRMVRHEGPSEQPFTFVGEFGVRQEGETGIYQMRARYYDTMTARFLSRDPIWPDLESPKAINPYQYASQNPLSFIDPMGLDYYVDQSGNPRPPDWSYHQAAEGTIVGLVRDNGEILWGHVFEGVVEHWHQFKISTAELMGWREWWRKFCKKFGLDPPDPRKVPPMPESMRKEVMAWGGPKCEKKSSEEGKEEGKKAIEAGKKLTLVLVKGLTLPMMGVWLLVAVLWASARLLIARRMKRK